MVICLLLSRQGVHANPQQLPCFEVRKLLADVKISYFRCCSPTVRLTYDYSDSINAGIFFHACFSRLFKLCTSSRLEKFRRQMTFLAYNIQFLRKHCRQFVRGSVEWSENHGDGLFQRKSDHKSILNPLNRHLLLEKKHARRQKWARKSAL